MSHNSGIFCGIFWSFKFHSLGSFYLLTAILWASQIVWSPYVGDLTLWLLQYCEVLGHWGGGPMEGSTVFEDMSLSRILAFQPLLLFPLLCIHYEVTIILHHMLQPWGAACHRPTSITHKLQSLKLWAQTWLFFLRGEYFINSVKNGKLTNIPNFKLAISFTLLFLLKKLSQVQSTDELNIVILNFSYIAFNYLYFHLFHIQLCFYLFCPSVLAWDFYQSSAQFSTVYNELSVN